MIPHIQHRNRENKKLLLRNEWETLGSEKRRGKWEITDGEERTRSIVVLEYYWRGSSKELDSFGLMHAVFGGECLLLVFFAGIGHETVMMGSKSPSKESGFVVWYTEINEFKPERDNYNTRVVGRDVVFFFFFFFLLRRKVKGRDEGPATPMRFEN